MSVRIVVNLNLFDVLAQDGSAPMTVKQIAAAVGTEETLLGRIFKNIAASDCQWRRDVCIWSIYAVVHNWRRSRAHRWRPFLYRWC